VDTVALVIVNVANSARRLPLYVILNTLWEK